MKNEIDLMARTMWAEARGEGDRGMLAVGNVIKNRAKKGGWWGRSIIEVVTKDYQFSVWNLNDPNRVKMLAVDETDPVFKSALTIAADLMSGNLPDNTGGADHYHTNSIMPNWAKNMIVTARIGNHIFYRSA